MRIHRVQNQNGDTTFFVCKDKMTGKIYFSMDGKAVDLSVGDAKTLIALLEGAIKQ